MNGKEQEQEHNLPERSQMRAWFFGVVRFFFLIFHRQINIEWKQEVFYALIHGIYMVYKWHKHTQKCRIFHFSVSFSLRRKVLLLPKLSIPEHSHTLWNSTFSLAQLRTSIYFFLSLLRHCYRRCCWCCCSYDYFSRI